MGPDDYCSVVTEQKPESTETSSFWQLLFVSMNAGRLSSPCVRFLTPQLTISPAERCRVKRLSKVTGVNS